MIKIKGSSIKIEGSGAELVTELSMIVHALYREVSENTDNEFAELILTKAFELGMKDEKEIVKELIEKLSEKLEEDGEEDE